MEESLDHLPWVDLPDLVTELILEHLPLPDYIRFAAVCRKWGSIQKDHRLRHSPRPPPMAAPPLPWLIPPILHLGRGIDCYSPLEKRLRRLRSPTAPTYPGRTLCMASFCGWLLMLVLDENDDLSGCYPTPPSPRRPFLFNPLTGAVISLPMLSIVPGLDCFAAFSSPPCDPDCTILLVSGGSSVFLCRSNDPGDGWATVVRIEEHIDSAIYCGGKFYCISWKGMLYVIDRVLSSPTLPPPLMMDVSALDDLRDVDMRRLVEFGGELFLVVQLYDLHRHDLEGFQVFRADLSEKKWVKKMDVLADHVLFLDEHCSFSFLALDVGCKKNSIYFAYWWDECRWSLFDLDARRIHEEPIGQDRFDFKLDLRRWFFPTLG